MTDNDIIKALERMAFIESRKGEVQKQKVLESAAEIINRQKAEIERLTARNFELSEKGEKVCIAYKTARAEAIKEFAERLKKEKYYSGNRMGYGTWVVEVESIDNLVKEMVG